MSIARRNLATCESLIRYKAERAGVEVLIREESYSRKGSALDLAPLPDYAKVKAGEQDEPAFSGRRIKGSPRASTQPCLTASRRIKRGSSQ